MDKYNFISVPLVYPMKYCWMDIGGDCHREPLQVPTTTRMMWEKSVVVSCQKWGILTIYFPITGWLIEKLVQRLHHEPSAALASTDSTTTNASLCLRGPPGHNQKQQFFVYNSWWCPEGLLRHSEANGPLHGLPHSSEGFRGNQKKCQVCIHDHPYATGIWSCKLECVSIHVLETSWRGLEAQGMEGRLGTTSWEPSMSSSHCSGAIMASICYPWEEECARIKPPADNNSPLYYIYKHDVWTFNLWAFRGRNKPVGPMSGFQSLFVSLKIHVEGLTH